MEINSNKRVLSDPRFKSLVRKKWWLSFGLSIGMTSMYAAFVLVVIFKPEWLLLTVTAANPFNLGLTVSLVMMLIIIGSMLCYVFFKGNDTHDDIRKLIADHDEAQPYKSD